MWYINRISFSEYLPEALKPAGPKEADTQNLRSRATTIRTAQSDANAKWLGLTSTVMYPGAVELYDAFRNNTEHLSDVLALGMDSIATAIEEFHSGVKTLWSGTYVPLRSSISSFNARHPYQYTNEDRYEAGLEGKTYPSVTRTFMDREALLSRYGRANAEYDALVNTCIWAIQDAHKAPKSKGSSINKYLQTPKTAWNFASTHLARAANFSVNGGFLTYTWTVAQKNWRAGLKSGLPKWAKLFPFVDDWKPGLTTNSMWFPNLPRRAKPIEMGGVTWTPASYTDKLPGASWHSTGQVLFSKPPSERTVKWLGRAEVLSEKMKKISDSKVFKGGAKVLAVIDMGVTYHDSYQKNYNEALRDNPTMNADQARNEAIKSAAIEGTAKNVGKVVGGVAGRAAGAAVGQALIPIPGVGAAVGGFVGGIVGEQVGGFVGEKVGGFVNDVRRNGWDGATEKLGKSISRAADDIGGTLKDVGKGAVKSVKKIFGWG